MKNGYMFFLNLGMATLIARISLLISVFAFLGADNFYMKVWIAVFAAVCLAISVIHAPSDDDAAKAVNHFYSKFKEKLEETRHSYSIQSVKIINGYKIKGSMRLKRAIGNDIVYPHLVGAAIAPSPERGKMVLYVSELSLLKKNDFEIRECLISDSDIELNSSVDGQDSSVVTLTLKCPLYPQGIALITKNDFHYREFVESISSLDNVK